MGLTTRENNTLKGEKETWTAERGQLTQRVERMTVQIRKQKDDHARALDAVQEELEDKKQQLETLKAMEWLANCKRDHKRARLASGEHDSEEEAEEDEEEQDD